MEEAKITQVEEPEQEPQDQPMYQQGRFPSIVDTDDLVFELGKQVVDKINKEKLLESILKKIKILEVAAGKAQELQTEAERRVLELKSSNKLYEENNRRLDKELVNVRGELESQKTEVIRIKTEFDNKEIENTRFNEALVGMRTELKSKSTENVKLKREQLSFEESFEAEKKFNKELNKKLNEIKSRLDEQKCIYEENEIKLNEEISNLKDISSKPKKKTKKKNLKG